MEPPYEEQYSQEGNPRAYMTMRDYRNLAWKNQQPLGRNPNPNRSMRDYRDQWRSAPVYSVPSTYPPPPQYDHPEPPFYASTPQSPQPPQSIPPFEQAILDLTKLVGDVVEEQKKINAQLSQKINTMENNVNKRIDGLQSEMEQKLDNLQYSISKLAQHLDHPKEESQEEECLSDTMAEKKCEQQPHEELIEDFIELSEGLAESSDMCDVVFPRENQEEIISLLTEEGSKTKAVEVPKKNVIQLNPIDLDTTATAQDTKYPLPVAPSADQVYFLPSPAPQPTPVANSKPAAPKAKSNPLPAAPPDSVFILPMPAAQPKPQASTTKATPSLLVLQNIRRLVASVQTIATTSKTRAAAYIAWHSGWFGCGFGFGTPGPRHF